MPNKTNRKPKNRGFAPGADPLSGKAYPVNPTTGKIGSRDGGKARKTPKSW